MALRGYDGASAFDLTAAKNNGGLVCSTYIVGNPGGFPHADKARVDAIRAKGMGALPNWERSADFFRTATLADCRAAGVEALSACRALGYPDDGSVSCAFSFDFEMAPVTFGAMADKLSAVQEGLGGHYRAIAYAQWAFLKFLADTGQPGPHWLMASTFGLAYDAGSPFVAMVQSHTADGNWLNSPVPGTDINTVTQPAKLGAWWPDDSEFAPMALTADDVWNYSWQDTDGNNEPAHTRLYRAEKNAFAANQDCDDLKAQVAALKTQLASVAAAVAKLQVAPIDPAALAQALVAHLGLDVVAK